MVFDSKFHLVSPLTCWFYHILQDTKSNNCKKSWLDTLKCKGRSTVPETERRTTMNRLAAAVKLIAAPLTCLLKRVRICVISTNQTLAKT